MEPYNRHSGKSPTLNAALVASALITVGAFAFSPQSVSTVAGTTPLQTASSIRRDPVVQPPILCWSYEHGTKIANVGLTVVASSQSFISSPAVSFCSWTITSCSGGVIVATSDSPGGYSVSGYAQCATQTGSGAPGTDIIPSTQNLTIHGPFRSGADYITLDYSDGEGDNPCVKYGAQFSIF
ncbi:MAG: hypothetical protein P4L33_16570 [Capsulimonadaceae bacterium]|nr:hypothetical protein [Capsulimonadaceae bacterium]